MKAAVSQTITAKDFQELINETLILSGKLLANTITLLSIGEYIFQVMTTKNADKTLNLNIYKKGTEYNWHTDGEPNNPIRDIKLTCLLNLSEDEYEGGNLKLFDAKEVEVENFNKPGSAIIFPSFINHKVTKLIKGERYTLAIWWYGPKFK